MAYRKRLDFKTILVDLSTNHLLEVLSNARTTTFAPWLQGHPSVDVSARNHAGTFAEGAFRLGPCVLINYDPSGARRPQRLGP
ncbi:MAG TPA: hypothetical protein VFT66_04045 [Roseiflexaceae bacterium]|jgi:hypothetical protein|nr:hypothetical protein [Roseiflexaceae bacterium]